ncbi:MAG TPA: response regulator [Burkholderiales bacterium]|jgi:class 3 adenylate cyclase
MTAVTDLAAAASRAPAQSAFRVLVVDDDPDMTRFLCLLLGNEGMAVETASDGESAMRSIVASPPEMVLLDVLLPGRGGFEICARLKSDPATALIPVILITALEDRESRVRGIKAGADDFLSKPVRREELLARVQTLRRLHETRRELEARRLAAEVQRKEAIRKAFSRYVSPRLAERIIGSLGSEDAPFREPAQRTDVVVLFADLRGFTSITESIEVHHVVHMLNEYFAVLTEAAYQHEGTIFNMAGDSLLVGFNVPLPQPDAAERALRAAIDMIARFAPVAAAWRRRHGIATGVGIGMCLGEAIIGNVGSPHYMSYTVVGDPVNTAARLTAMAQADEVLVSGTLFDALRSLVSGRRVEPRGDVALRGKSEPVPVYAIRL